MQKMIVMDIDGTLLHFDGKCSKEEKDYLNHLKEAGYIIVLATGRCFEEVLAATDNAFFANYIISHTGSVIYDVSLKKFIFESKINENTVKKIIASYDEKTIKWISLITLNKYNRFSLKYYENSKFRHMITDLKKLNDIGNDVFNICIDVKQNNYVSSIIDKMKSKFKNLDFIIMQDSFSSEKRIVIVSKKISKSFAIKKIALLEKIDSSNIICFGDGLNDIDMLKYCGVSVAMGNALEEVKKVCKYVTDTNDNKGIMKFLSNYLVKEL